jgi:uncharacterized coiled-coil protein SlyX
MPRRRSPLRAVSRAVSLNDQVVEAEAVLGRLKEQMRRLVSRMTGKRAPAVHEQMARLEADLRRLEADMLKLLARVHHVEAQVRRA